MNYKNKEITPIFGAESLATAYIANNYPYGRLQCTMHFFIESVPKRGDRYVTQSINPKDGRLNAPHKGTYYTYLFLYMDDQQHIHSIALSPHHSDTFETDFKFLSEQFGIDGFNEIQQKNLREDYRRHIAIHHAYCIADIPEEQKREYRVWVVKKLNYIATAPFLEMCSFSEPEPQDGSEQTKSQEVSL